jgi:hypothetical protein
MAGYLPQNRGNRSPNRTGPAVSRRLRAAGWNISPAANRHVRDGVYVKAMGDLISILIDTGHDARNQEAAEGIRDMVSTWPQVSGVSVSGHDARWVRFTYTTGK